MARAANPFGRALNCYVGAIIFLGLFVMAANFMRRQTPLLGDRPTVFLLFAALLVGSELRPISWLRRQEGGEVTASWAFGFALLLLAPAASAITAMAAASLVGDLVNRKPLVRGAFNASQVALSLAAGSAVLHLHPSHGRLIASDGVTLSWLFTVVMAAVATFLLNGLLTSLVLGLYQGLPLLPVVRTGIAHNLSTDGILLALGPIFVVVSQRSLVLLPLLLLIAWAVYRSTYLAIARQHEASHDLLTDLPNRRMFLEAVEASVTDAARHERSAAVVICDLNGFKEVNDRLGHGVGDLVLLEVATRLAAAKRTTDIVARLGGDEFAVLLSHVEGVDSARRVADRFADALLAPCVVNGFPLAVSGSFGVAVLPDHGATVHDLLDHADVAMYTAKRAGAPVHVYSAERDRFSTSRLSLLGELPNAIRDHELVLHYQPKIDLQTSAVVGVEALVRWQHPRLGLIGPDQFMPMAEQTELMGPFTEYVLREALRQSAAWTASGRPLHVAVNGSARNLHDLRFPSVVADILDETGVDPSLLELEITENTVMADPTRTTKVLTDLRSLGIGLSIDDFGTGYSSLANLRDLPVDRIKIDRSFVKEMLERSGDAVIVRSIIELASNLGLGTIAEGVEDVEVLDALRGLGCGFGQGFVISRPVPSSELDRWLLRERSLAVRGVA